MNVSWYITAILCHNIAHSTMRIAILLLALLCSACSSSLPSIRPYHMDIQQGNVVTNKMMLQLRPGMTKAQVRFVMGTPLITDSFHSDRWDYFYSMKKDGRLIEQRRVILEFEDDKLKHVRGDVIPAGGSEGATADDKGSKAAPKSIWENKPVEPKKEKGLLDKLKFWGDDDKQPQAQPKLEEMPPPQPKRMPEEKTQAPAAELPVQKTPDEKKPESAKEEKGWLDKLKFWGDDKGQQTKPEAEQKAAPETAKPVSKPLPKALPKVVDKPAEPAPAAPVKVEESAPKQTGRAVPKAETVEKAAPAPADLPPEDDPGYFERMLEKIGF